ncbi:S53 family peptidase [Dictyobacter kobayashii]|nr:S53 family peptidase [Dictyobacter kobayashii]
MSARNSRHAMIPDIHYNYLGRVNDPLAYKCQTQANGKHCYGVNQMRNAYSVAPLLSQGFTGKGRTIVILDAYQAPHLRDDLGDFDARFGLAPIALNIVAPQGVPSWDSHSVMQQTWSAEISVDVEWAHAIAPDAAITLVEAKSENDPDLIPALNYAIDKNLGDIISMSFGEGEDCPGADVLRQWHDAFVKATSKKITLFSSAGDSGVAQQTCDGNSWHVMASTPASDTLVTGVGGTTLNADEDTGDYSSETAWNEPALKSASGGGFSATFQKPAYQDQISVINKKRGVPDVAYNSSTDGGVITVWSDGSNGPGGIYSFGGTSVGAPQWSAIVAIADQYSNQRLGLINPILYKIGNTPDWYHSAFHDIVSGNNGIELQATPKAI